MTTVLAIDQGTSGTKAVVVDAVDGVLAVAEQPVAVQHRGDGAVEVDPQALLDSVLVAGREALAAARRPVDVVGLANQGETVLAWDRSTGRPLTSAIVWQDRRAQGIVDDLADSHAMLAERTGLVADPYFSAPKMAWLRREVTASGVVTTSDSWLVHQLCGEFVTDVATASRSMLTSLDAPGWDYDLLGVFGLDGEELPRIVACDEIVGSTGAFGGDVPLGGLIVDQQAALLAEGCLDAGDAKCTFGTGAFLLADAGTRPLRSTSGLAASVAWRLRESTSFCLDGQVYAAAAAVRWLQDLGVIGSAADVDRVAAADTDGVIAVPALAGLAAPWWRPSARASITGLTLSTGRGELVLAVVLGIAAQVAELVDATGRDLGRALTALCADGGLTRSRTLMQATADITQIPLQLCGFDHVTALGTAATARLSVDRSLAVTDALTPWTATQTFEPQWSADRAAQFRAQWRRAAEAIA